MVLSQAEDSNNVVVKRAHGGVLVAPIVFASVLCLLASPAVAGEDVVEDIVIFSDLADDLQETPGFDSGPKKAEDSNWSFMLGVLGGVKPEYEGSKDYEFGELDLLSVTQTDTGPAFRAA